MKIIEPSAEILTLHEPTSDQDEIETRIALRQITTSTWEATLQPKHKPSPEAVKAALSSVVLVDWKKVADQMPDSDETVLVYGPTLDPDVWLGYHDGECWRDVAGEKLEPVLAWAPLPEPPNL